MHVMIDDELNSGLYSAFIGYLHNNDVNCCGWHSNRQCTRWSLSPFFLFLFLTVILDAGRYFAFRYAFSTS